MRYSLLSRFQGAMLGAALGDWLGSDRQKTIQGESPLGASWGTESIRSAEALIRRGTDAGPGAEADVQLLKHPEVQKEVEKPEPETFASGAELVLSTLPISLFFHDSNTKLRQMIQQAPRLSGFPQIQDGALAIGFAIAQCLKEQLEPLQLLPQIIHYLRPDSLNSEVPAPVNVRLDFIEQLGQTQALLQAGSNLQTASRTLLPPNWPESVSGAIALAFFCFLSTPEEMAVSLRRASRSNSASQIVCAITGLLAGAHNSSAGIPLEWGMILSDPACFLAGGVSGVEICQLSTRLLFAWSGVYNVDVVPSSATAIAAPGVIRPR